MTENDKMGLPAKFEDFAEQMAEEPKPRRRSAPAAKSRRPRAEDVPGVGGMIETRWSGLPMWSCPKCHGTTFKPSEAKVHQCKKVKFADEEGLAG